MLVPAGDYVTRTLRGRAHVRVQHYAWAERTLRCFLLAPLTPRPRRRVGAGCSWRSSSWWSAWLR